MDVNGTIYDVFAETSAKAAGIHEGNLTYIGDDGLRRCKVCGKKLETILHFNSPALKSMYNEKDGLKVNCICLCDKEKIEKAHKEMQMLAKKSDAPIMRAECFKSKAMYDMIFKNDDSPNSEAGALTRRYIKNFTHSSTWLFIYGTYGTGKSFYAACIANALIDKGYTVRMGTGADYEAEIFAAQDKAAAYQKLLDYDLLILDDFASERKSDYMFEVLYNIINDRYNAKKPIVFTSNMTTEETGNPTDPRIRRIMSRIWERGYPVEMVGQDRRKANTAWK
jgi:DNA replication protein DnaC